MKKKKLQNVRFISLVTPANTIKTYSNVEKLCKKYSLSYSTLSKKLNRNNPDNRNEEGKIDFEYSGFRFCETFLNEVA